MILIADSGSTKASWVLASKTEIVLEFTSSGFNPYTQPKELIYRIISEEIFPKLNDISIESIYFYGAGCSSDSNKKLMSETFKSFFVKSNIEIEHDVMAAARALWLDGDGIIAILGTGSNSSLYKKGEIIYSIPALGYILGDEGSGAYLGKAILRDYLYNRMPEEISKDFHDKYALDAATILANVYQKENPNRWLASFAVFISENINEDYYRNIVLKSFRDFFESHLIQYPDYQNIPLGVIGSIGYYFREQLEIVSKEYGFSLKKVIKSPIDELVKYHMQRGE